MEKRESDNRNPSQVETLGSPREDDNLRARGDAGGEGGEVTIINGVEMEDGADEPIALSCRLGDVLPVDNTNQPIRRFLQEETPQGAVQVLAEIYQDGPNDFQVITSQGNGVHRSRRFAERGLAHKEFNRFLFRQSEWIVATTERHAKP